MADLTLKIGAEFSFASQFTDEETGDPEDLTGYGLTSHIATACGEFRDELTAVWTDASIGTFDLSSVSTSNWPTGELFWDVAVTTPAGAPVYTDTFCVETKKAITQL